MQINSIQSDCKPSFQAKVSSKFTEAAKNYFQKNPVKLEAFEKKVDTYKYYGLSDVNVFHERVILNGKPHYALYAAKDGAKPEEYALLTVKDAFRKVIEKFMRINKYEFNLKTKDIK